MKRNTKSKDNNSVLLSTIFILLCIFGAAFSVKKFYESFNLSLTKMNEKPVARITFKHKTAQRKFEERMIWDRLRQDSPIYNGDVIRTAPESEATIYFSDGNIMELGENTMAQVVVRDGKVQTSVQGGSVVMNSSGAKNGAVISFGNSTIELSAGSSLGTSVSENGDSTINVISGDATFNSADGTARAIAEGNSLALDENAQERIIPLITVLNPKPNEKILNFENMGESQVAFKWNVQNLDSDDFLILEIASDKKFQNIIIRRELKDLKEANAQLKDGSFYWRIFPSKQGAEFSAQSKVSILNTPKPELVIPESHADFVYKVKLPNIRFSWTQNEWVSAFDFEVADNPRMAEPVVKQRITTPSSIVSTLEEGVWYWRVTPFYTVNGAEFAEPSEVRVFTISQKNSLDNVELILPAAGETVNTEISDNLAFSWKNNSEIGEYEIVVASDSDFANEKIRRRQKTNFFSVKPSELGMQTGEWFWYVSQFDSDGDFSNKSEVRKFFTDKIEFEQKLLYPPENYSVNDENISGLRFAWKTNVPGETILQIARDENFSQTVLNQTNAEGVKNFSGANLGGGNYFWRIVSKEDPQKYKTQARSINVVAPLEKPNLVSPTNDTLLLVRSGARSVFSWNEVSGADYYLFNLYSSKNSEEPIYSRQVTSNNYSFALENFPDGEYSWSVQAGAEEKSYAAARLSETSESEIRVKQIRNVALTFPSNGTQFAEEAARENPGVVRWNPNGQNLASSNFTVSRNSNGISQPIFSLQNPPHEIRLPPLEPGRYYWTVSARTEEGIDVSARARNFVVNEKVVIPEPVVPAPPAPVQEIPPAPKKEAAQVPMSLGTIILLGEATNNAVFDAERIRQSRAITFEWTSVPEADEYLFVLQNDRGKTLFTRTFTQTKFRLNDMADLGGGTYTWSVQALKNSADGNIERCGESSVSMFAIDLPEIDEIIINDTGILYGF